MTATTKQPQPFKGWSATAVYMVDNGAMLCGSHLGMSAKYTGRDISGQKIHRMSPAEVQEMADFFRENGLDHPYRAMESGALCESCRYAK